MTNDRQEKALEVREVVAANLSRALFLQRWSERKAATALGLTNTYVNRRASGLTECSASDLAMFSEFLDMPVSEFFKQRTADYGYAVSPAGSLMEYGRLAAVTPIFRATA
jgi:transcriptional regulator with XRE-family HTH domain